MTRPGRSFLVSGGIENSPNVGQSGDRSLTYMPRFGAGSFGCRASITIRPPTNTWLRPVPSVQSIDARQIFFSALCSCQPPTGSQLLMTTFSPECGRTVIGLSAVPLRGKTTVSR